MFTKRRFRLPSLALATAALGASVVVGCSSDAGPPEATGEVRQANMPWVPSPALVTRLQILGRLPVTEQRLANLAYFRNAGAAAPSMSVGLTLADGLFYTQGFGTVGSGEPTPTTVYEVGSLTKVYTAAGMLKLIEMNPGMSLDDPVSKYYSPITSVTYPLGTPAACPLPCPPSSDPITLRHLLTHTSGLPNYGTTYPAGTNVLQPTEAQFDQMVGAEGLQFYPGYNRTYSGVGMTIAGRIIEIVSHQTYATFMENNVLAPLAMNLSVYDPINLPLFNTVLAPSFNENPSETYAAYTCPAGDTCSGLPCFLGTCPPRNTFLIGALAPAGQLLSTVRDLSQFLVMQLSVGVPNPPVYPLSQADLVLSHHDLMKSPIPPPALTDPCRDLNPPSDPTTSPCYGGAHWFNTNIAGAAWWYGGTSDPLLGNWLVHNGALGGYWSDTHLAPDVGIASTALTSTNQLDSNDPNSGLVWNTTDALLRDAATAKTNPAVPWTGQPLPAALEGLMALLNSGAVNSVGIGQTFTPAFINSNPSLATMLQGWQSQLGTCSSFTVQHVSSNVSAVVTLMCSNAPIALAISAAPAAPYQVANLTELFFPLSTGKPGVQGGHAGVALVGGAGWNTIPIATSNGDGTFSATNGAESSGDTGFTVYATQTGATPVAGDFNGDGIGDVALTSGVGWNTVPVAFANGDGTFRGTNGHVTSGFTAFTLAATQTGARPVPGDFNGDGYGDVALTSGVGWGTIPVAFSNGDGTFHATNLGETWGDVGFASDASHAGATPVFGDFDGDGRTDIALTGGTGWNTIPIAFSNGDGTFHGTNLGVTSGFTAFVVAATQAGAKPLSGDFNGDGKADIALTGGIGWGSIPIAFSNGDGTFRATNRSETSGDSGFPVYATQTGAKPVFGDFDGDGRADIALTGGAGWNTVPVAFSNGDGTFRGSNGHVTSGFTAFTTAAASSGVRPVGQ